MKSKLNYLIGISLKRKIVTKWFVIANIVLAAFIIAIANVDTIINYFGGDFTSKQVVYVIDNTGKSFDTFKLNMDTLNVPLTDPDVGSNYAVKKYDKTIAEVKAEIKKDGKKWAIVFDNDPETVIKVIVISEGFINTVDYQLLTGAINSTKVSLALANSNVSPALLQKIYQPLEIKRELIDNTKKSADEAMSTIMSTVFPVVILPFFMLTIFLVQMIGAEVNDEKTTRGMEIIISNVSPKTHFFAKVVAGNLFVLIQGALLLLFGGIGLLIRNLTGGNTIANGLGDAIGTTVNKILETGLADKLIYVIPLTLILMVITFVSYSLLAGILASMTTNIEDFQQVQTPIIMISLVGYYLSMMAGLFEGSVLIRFLSYVPFISAILSPSLLVLGYIGIFDVMISIGLVILTNYLLVKYGLKIYKVGILNYSSSDLWKKMFKALKN